LPESRAVIFGHSHRQICESRDGVLYLNPGAAGRSGFHRLQTAALLRIESGEPRVELLELGPRLPAKGTRASSHMGMQA
jgi:predicted phosphodiesterase